jgi:hypothetical protein
MIILPVFLYSIRVRITSERQTALGATDEDLSDSPILPIYGKQLLKDTF